MHYLVLAVAVLTFLTAAVGFMMSFRRIQAVHLLVNSQLHDLLARVTQLTDALTAAGVDVPVVPGSGKAGERLSGPRRSGDSSPG